MSMQKLPVQGLFVKPQVEVPGQTGAHYSTGAITLPTANRVSITRFLLSGAAITLDGVNATVTLAAHLNTKIGQQVTFSGATGVGGLLLNRQTWTIGSITTSGVYTFPCTATGAVTGTIVQEPVFTLPQGFSYCLMYANANVEVNVDNTNGNPNGYQVLGIPTAIPIGSTPSNGGWNHQLTGNSSPVFGLVASDGFSARIRCMGTTATSYFSVIG